MKIFLFLIVTIVVTFISGCSSKEYEIASEEEILKQYSNVRLQNGLYRNIGFGKTPAEAIADATINRLYSADVEVKMRSSIIGGDQTLDIMPYSKNEKSQTAYCKQMSIKKVPDGNFFVEYHCMEEKDILQYYTNLKNYRQGMFFWWNHIAVAGNQSKIITTFVREKRYDKDELELFFANWGNLSVADTEMAILEYYKWKLEKKPISVFRAFYPFKLIYNPHIDSVQYTGLADYEIKDGIKYLPKTSIKTWDKYGNRYKQNYPKGLE